MAQNNLVQRILDLTSIIHNEFPELYIHLAETPLFLSGYNTGIEKNEYEQYLESLRLQLHAFEHNHPVQHNN